MVSFFICTYPSLSVYLFIVNSDDVKSHSMIIKGYLKLREEYESGDGLYIDGEILSEQLEDIKGKNATVRFYISDTEKSFDELKENLIRTISGDVNAYYGDTYSEYTGYLWTNDQLNIGEHDLIEDLSNYDGKYCYLAIDFQS